MEWSSTYSLWNTLSDDGNGSDLWVLHQLHGGLVDGSRGSKVDDGIDILVLLHCLFNGLVNWEEGLAGSPVHLGDELATEGVDDTGDGWGFTLADEVEIQHSLDSSWLETINEASGLVVEESLLTTWTQWPGWSSEAADVVVGVSAAGRWRKAVGAVGSGRRRHVGIEVFCRKRLMSVYARSGVETLHACPRRVSVTGRRVNLQVR